MLTRIAILTLAALTLAGAGSFANDAKVKPLFDVKIDHEFPNASTTFDEVKRLILDNYYTDEITEEALYWAAIQGMLRHISPPDNPDLSKIMTPLNYEGVKSSLEGVQVSIGIKSSFNQNDGSLTVAEILPESPAENILQRFDRILRIDSVSLKGKPVAEIDDLLKGPEDSKVTLTINRDIKVFDVTLTRQQVNDVNLTITALNKQIAHIEIKRFSLGTSENLKAGVEEQIANGVRGFILDLRNNTGGVFSEALKSAEVFLPKKSIILRTFDREKKLQNYISTNENPPTLKMAVLVNDNTASAAEIMIGSLRDHKVAFVLGTRTYGKGVFEKTFTLENEYRVKFITGAMYTPYGKAWQGKGLPPDFAVEQDEKAVAALLKLDPVKRYSKDVAMITAVKLLGNYGESLDDIDAGAADETEGPSGSGEKDLEESFQIRE